jgi:hypothetical protein
MFFSCFLYCNHQVHRDFLITLCMTDYSQWLINVVVHILKYDKNYTKCLNGRFN